MPVRSGGDDALALENASSRELFDLLDSVEDTTGDIFERGLNRRRRLAPIGLPKAIALALDQNRLRRGAATIGSDDDV
jgi:hypothetical protein